MVVLMEGCPTLACVQQFYIRGVACTCLNLVFSCIIGKLAQAGLCSVVLQDGMLRLACAQLLQDSWPKLACVQ